MQNALIINGRMTGPTSVELDEPVPGLTGQVEVTLRAKPITNSNEETVFEFLRRLPPGTRSAEDVDRQMREERDSWEDNR